MRTQNKQKIDLPLYAYPALPAGTKPSQFPFVITPSAVELIKLAMHSDELAFKDFYTKYGHEVTNISFVHISQQQFLSGMIEEIINFKTEATYVLISNNNEYTLQRYERKFTQQVKPILEKECELNIDKNIIKLLLANLNFIDANPKDMRELTIREFTYFSSVLRLDEEPDLYLPIPLMKKELESFHGRSFIGVSYFNGEKFVSWTFSCFNKNDNRIRPPARVQQLINTPFDADTYAQLTTFEQSFLIKHIDGENKELFFQAWIETAEQRGKNTGYAHRKARDMVRKLDPNARHIKNDHFFGWGFTLPTQTDHYLIEAFEDKSSFLNPTTQQLNPLAILSYFYGILTPGETNLTKLIVNYDSKFSGLARNTAIALNKQMYYMWKMTRRLSSEMSHVVHQGLISCLKSLLSHKVICETKRFSDHRPIMRDVVPNVESAWQHIEGDAEKIADLLMQSIFISSGIDLSSRSDTFHPYNQASHYDPLIEALQELKNITEMLHAKNPQKAASQYMTEYLNRKYTIASISMTSLKRALLRDNLQAIVILLKHGADLSREEIVLDDLEFLLEHPQINAEIVKDILSACDKSLIKAALEKTNSSAAFLKRFYPMLSNAIDDNNINVIASILVFMHEFVDKLSISEYLTLSSDERPPLFWQAVATSNQEIVQLLMEWGANPDICFYTNEKVITIANKEIASILKSSATNIALTSAVSNLHSGQTFLLFPKPSEIKVESEKCNRDKKARHQHCPIS